MKQQSYDLFTKSAVTVLQRERQKENPAAGWARGFGVRYGVSAELDKETRNSPCCSPWVRKGRRPKPTPSCCSQRSN